MNFTIERVKEAYRKSEIVPIHGLFVDWTYDNDGNAIRCGCAVTAMLIAECGVTYEEIKHLNNVAYQPVYEIAEFASDKLGEDAKDIRAFIHGFDDAFLDSGESEEIFDIGYAVWKAVKDGVWNDEA